jgi:hypothetical protein
MAPRFPLPPVGEEQEAAMMAELAHRQQLSGARSGAAIAGKQCSGCRVEALAVGIFCAVPSGGTCHARKPSQQMPL